ncbi:YihY/virulence factor BrkB family protein [Sphingomonas lenta]|uniref:Ribonuclease BN n=1 Tax=Sphingomonas lenta TaxID=1141887 RepID=A0A2A2SCS4_9SPHN|nr:YihY/virulence factor BrkB family protein [Sphingomonas lenta]PAX07094.1 ribonuclease BN [Sphingomonas lenta]
MTDSKSGGGQGRDAPSPWKMPAGGWWAALKRTQKEMGDDNVGLIAAGTAFYAFASIIPVLGAVVLSYGLFASQERVVADIESLFASLPREAASVIQDQLLTVVRTEGGKQGIGLVVALALALYGGTKAASAIVTALNIAYEQKETRGIVKLYLLYFAIVIGAVVLVLGAIASTTVLAFLDSLLPNLGGAGKFVIRLLSYALIAALAVTAGACLYRYGPNRENAKWAWLTPGSAIATLLWLVGTALFGLYVSNFANYGATYGSLSAVIVLLTWLWLSAYVYLFGAELNSELERQTQRDTTTGAEKPMGARGATAADTVAEGDEAGEERRDGSARPARARQASGGVGVVPAAIGLRTAGRVTGHKPGLAPTLLTAVGLSRLGRGGNAVGAALVAAGAALAWLGRDKPKPKARKEAVPAVRP